MRVSSLVGAAEAPPPILPHTRARAHTLAPMLVGADVLGGPLHPPVLPRIHARARTLALTLVGADVLGGPLHLPVLPLTSPSPQKI